MTKSEIKANQLIADAIDKIIEKYQKKADKEREKVRQACVSYKGEKFCSDVDRWNEEPPKSIFEYLN